MRLWGCQSRTKMGPLPGVILGHGGGFGVRLGARGHDLVVPDNISLLLLPPYSPALNPVGNIWPYLRANWLAISVFDDYHAIVDACCEAWNRVADQPEIATSINTRVWAKVNP